MASSSDELLYLFNHVFLPPKLPQKDDYDAGREKALLSVTIDGLITWKNCIEPARRGQAEAAASTIHNMQQAYSGIDGSLNETEVFSLLAQLADGKSQNFGCQRVLTKDRRGFTPLRSRAECWRPYQQTQSPNLFRSFRDLAFK
jgi:hypothetical protein